MAKKDDLIKEAKGLGIELDSNETVADLEAKIALAKEGTPVGDVLPLSKVNRGSRRRIGRAIEQLNQAMDAAISELDRQVFVPDEDGKRGAEWSAVTRLREAQAEINDQVNQLFAS